MLEKHQGSHVPCDLLPISEVLLDHAAAFGYGRLNSISQTESEEEGT